MAKFATSDFLIENATASLNGCHIIVATKDVANLIMEELRKHNFAPERIGFVEKKGSSSVSFATDISQFVASKVNLSRMIATPERHDAPAPPPSSTAALILRLLLQMAQLYHKKIIVRPAIQL